jgi:hypothetical protein
MGVRSPTGSTGGMSVDKGRQSSGRKRDVVLRLLRAETLDALGRELTGSPAKLAQWRDDFLPAENVESKCPFLIRAMISFKISIPRLAIKQ